jgi:hypothetical protein
MHNINQKIMVFLIFLSCLLIISLSSFTSAATTVHITADSHTATTVSLTWTKTTDLLFDNYAVTYSMFVNGPYTTVATIKDSSKTSYAITGLSPNTAYFFIINDTSNDIIGKSTQSSNCLQVNTNPVPVLSSPSKTTTTVGLQWSDYNSYSSSVPFKNYVIQMCVSGGQWSTLTTITDYTQNTYTVTGLSPGIYQFIMFDQVGDSAQYGANSNTVTVSTYEPLQAEISNPFTTSIKVGEQVQLTTQGSGGSGYYNYQWYQNGNLLFGQTASTYLFKPSSSGSYSVYCKITDAHESSLDSANTASVTFTVPTTIDATLVTPAPTPEFSSLIVILLLVLLSIVTVVIKKNLKS